MNALGNCLENFPVSGVADGKECKRAEGGKLETL